MALTQQQLRYIKRRFQAAEDNPAALEQLLTDLGSSTAAVQSFATAELGAEKTQALAGVTAAVARARDLGCTNQQIRDAAV